MFEMFFHLFSAQSPHLNINIHISIIFNGVNIVAIVLFFTVKEGS